MNQFFVTASAEKVSALKTESYLNERKARGDNAAFDAWLNASPCLPLKPGMKYQRPRQQHPIDEAQ